MVTHEENIRRMQSEGLINDRQADLLRSAVQGPASASPAPEPHPARWLLPILAAVILLILAVMLLSAGTETEAIQDIAQTLNQPGSTAHMNRNLTSVLGIALILIMPLLVLTWLYNSIVSQEEKAMESWAQVEAAYQRRADLIPALVETVSRYVKHEQAALEQVTANRAQTTPDADVDQLLKAQKQANELLRAQLGKAPTDEKLLADLANAQTIVGKRAQQLIAVAEAYPQLRASDQFLQLQAQFEGTENRILTARNRFNETVETYNASIRKLPGSLIAGIGHFQRKAYFKAAAVSAQTPERKW
ncbi:LemA family protein [Propionivibrio sp.]|uniref:LemA family protein n=1 Tax=Propionivibrio sp. TaxID=2212460 RepID=UPI002627AB14|nr:LemA family protein [Propionivibrio sp.]